ncbi:MAG: hypothetical protein ABW110_12020 [Steroidobacteraceae bacterium]
MRRVTLLALCFAIGGCTVIKINHDDTETITYTGGPDVAEDLTTRACRKAGQQSSEIISTVNKDSKLPPGTGRQVTTFRCSPNPKPPAPESGS